MKYKLPFLLITFFLLFLSIGAFAQYLPFQGKLLENGQPVNGTKTFLFSITSPGINWNETHPNVPVNNGLYAVVLGSISDLPTNLFAAQTALTLNISVNGVPLDIVPIYPPIEADPTVPGNLKDGVSWNEIGNIPPKIYADTSATNELQHLSIQGNYLTISNGNTVEIPTLSDSTILEGDLVVGSTLQVGIQDTLQTSICQPQTSNEYSLENAVWQSYIPGKSGFLTSVQLEFGDIFNTNIKLTIYPGQGNTGQAIWSKTYDTGPFPAEIGFRSFPVDLYTIPLTSGQELTFEVKGVSNNIFVTKVPNNPYTAGLSSFGATYDLKFCVHSEYFTETGLFVDEDGNVGIGTNTPGAKLEIKGGESSDTDALLVKKSSGDPALSIDNAGKVGIGTGFPSTDLDVSGNTKITGDMQINGNTTQTGNLNLNGNMTVNGIIFPSQGINNMQVFTTSGTWMRPPGVTRVFVEVVGGGGEGGSNNYIQNHNNGGSSSFSGNTTIIATGGGGGNDGYGNNYSGGGGGCGSGGTFNLCGQDGDNGKTLDVSNGGSSRFGYGGKGAFTVNQVGYLGNGFGAGGGGAWVNNSGVFQSTGAGGGGGYSAGFIVVSGDIQVIVGSGGSGNPGADGTGGVVIVYW